jgi:hypothetical protein
VNQTLAELKLRQRRDKLFIGRISRGFDFLGYAFTPAGRDAPRQRSNDAPDGRPSLMSKVWTCSTSGHTLGAGCRGEERS